MDVITRVHVQFSWICDEISASKRMGGTSTVVGLWALAIGEECLLYRPFFGWAGHDPLQTTSG